MSGVATRRPMRGRVTQRSGSAASSRSKSVAAVTSEAPCSPSYTRCVSAVRQRQATSRSPKLSAVIWSSGAYFVLKVSAAYERHSPSVAPCCASTDAADSHATTSVAATVARVCCLIYQTLLSDILLALLVPVNMVRPSKSSVFF